MEMGVAMPKLDLAAIKARVEATTMAKMKAQEVLQKCDEGYQQCHTCPALGCCDNAARTDIPLLVARVEELQEALLGMVQQHCTGQWPTDNPEWFGSGCLSANANAIELLCEYGILEEVGESVGRAVEARAALSGEDPK